MRVCILLLVALSATYVQFVSGAVPQHELLALTDIYNATGGEDWTDNTNWLVGDPCENTWVGITCTPALTYVLEIDLSRNNLQGTLPNVFDQIHYLNTTSFSNNRDLAGPLPSTILNAREMRVVDLSSCSFSGAIPELTTNSSLVSLELNNNELSYSIPTSVFESFSLVTLSLGNNNLNGTIPDVFQPGNSFNDIDLTTNQLTGNLPLSLVSSTNLQILYVGSNDLSGSIPDAFSSTPLGDSVRRKFHFDRNHFSGAVPASLLAMPGMVELVLSYNEFSGVLPDTFASSQDWSQYVYVASNKLTGTLPSSLLSMSSLGSFDGSDNSFTDFGTWVGTNHQTDLNLDNNAITSFPTTDQLAGVYSFSLNENLLTGSIPSDIDFTGVSSVEIMSNGLTGSIPSAVYNLFEFRAAYNSLSGTIPENLDDLKIQTFEVQYNQLTGKVETDCPLLDYYNLEGNCFDCPLPSCCALTWCENDSSCDCNIWNSFGGLIVTVVVLLCCCCAGAVAIFAGLVVVVKRRRRVSYETLNGDNDEESS